jgi:hypothetical protein
MKMIKTYEGFFDFFKKKEKKPPVKLDEVMECLYDLTDEHRIKNDLNGDRFDGIFVDDRYVFKRKPSMGLGDDHDALMNDVLQILRGYRDRHFRLSSDHSSSNNAISFRIIYTPYEGYYTQDGESKISDSEVNELLLDCSSKLEIYGCKLSFFIGWGRDEGSTDDREWNDFMRMIDKTIKRSTFPQRPRNVTIKITSPTGFN